MIETLHKKGLEMLFKSHQPVDNGAQATLRNITLKESFSLGDMISNIHSDDMYTIENGLVLENKDSQKAQNMSFLKQEWQDWMDGIELGESRSQDCYPQIWKGKFDNYCYSDRFGSHFDNHLDRLGADAESRKNFFTIWKKEDEVNVDVPCTIGYNVQVVNGVAYFSFVYRSIEIVHNFVNDLFLNREYILSVADHLNLPEDTIIDITYFVMNAHSYAKTWSPYYKEV